jgi:hypothetical protein
MYFRGYEFYCLECGGMFGFLSPRAEDTTPELKALYEQLDVEFQENVGGKLIVEGRTGSDKAQEQHNKALAWMAGRKTR